jgi:hypothetical protein
VSTPASTGDETNESQGAYCESFVALMEAISYFSGDSLSIHYGTQRVRYGVGHILSNGGHS